MIVSKTPFRISFFGGGSDLPSYYNQSPGMVVSATINKYLYISLNKKFDDSIRVSYSVTENVNNVDDLKHDIVKHTLKYFDVTKGIELASISDLPSNGTGMGASSAFAVGLIQAIELFRFEKETLNKSSLAELACQIEINLCKKPIGKQDQYAASYGGFNAIYFHGNEVRIKPVDIEPSAAFELDSNLLAFNTGITRQAPDILTQQVDNIVNHSIVDQTKAMVELAKNGLKLLQKRKIDEFGELLDHGWKIKKMLSDNISNQQIDEMYDRAMKNGALGGKLLGAGGGGYLLVYVQDKYKIGRAHV